MSSLFVPSALELGEVVCAPGVERTDLIDAALNAALTAFGTQSPQLAERHRDLARDG